MKYRLNSEKILFTQLGDEGVVYDTEKNEYISLNETFFKILKGVEVGLEVDQIVHNLCNEYAISEEDCKREVENALLRLEEKKYVLK